MLKLLGLVVALVGLALGLFGCDDEGNGDVSNSNQKPILEVTDANTNSFDLSVFEKNRELWTSKNIQNYRMIIGASGFMTNFPEEVLIEVRNRKAKSVKTFSTTGRNATFAYSGYQTVENLFSFLGDQHKRGVKRLEVNYDPNIGYPRWIQLDQDGFAGNDDELTLKVRSLEVVK